MVHPAYIAAGVAAVGIGGYYIYKRKGKGKNAQKKAPATKKDKGQELFNSIVANAKVTETDDDEAAKAKIVKQLSNPAVKQEVEQKVAKFTPQEKKTWAESMKSIGAAVAGVAVTAGAAYYGYKNYMPGTGTYASEPISNNSTTNSTSNDGFN
mmetsp:Transcript_11836/g.31966  ORF Transcript_11836/g.31966 Transcript_11836/m.31966 type:complete len:153 (+) Transcript_11836:121-579(+)